VISTRGIFEILVASVGATRRVAPTEKENRMYGFSTGWNIRRHARLRDALEEIQQFGFEQVEVTGLNESQMREAVVLQQGGGSPRIVGVHSFCPLPPVEREASFGDQLDLASLDDTERNLALDYSKRTIDFAAELGARVVVVHLGSVKVEYVPMTIYRWLTTYGGDTDEYRSQLDGLLQERSRRSAPHFDAAMRSLSELETHARDCKVSVGVENRYMYYQIPNREELGTILAEFGPDTVVGYWHDVGHAYVNRMLGVEDQTIVPDGIKSRMIGIHIHDVMMDSTVRPPKIDHRAPSTGIVDFVRERENVGDGALKIVELRREVRSDDVRKGLDYLRSIRF